MYDAFKYFTKMAELVARDSDPAEHEVGAPEVGASEVAAHALSTPEVVQQERTVAALEGIDLTATRARAPKCAAPAGA